MFCMLKTMVYRYKHFIDSVFRYWCQTFFVLWMGSMSFTEMQTLRI